MFSIRELLGEEPTKVIESGRTISTRELLGERPTEVEEPLAKDSMSVRELLGEGPAIEPSIATIPLAKPSVHPATAYLEKFTKPSIEEYDKYQMAPLITAENVAPAMDTLGRLWNLAQHPYDVVKGAAVFASEIPGFIGGLASAIGQVPIEILKGGTVLDWYNASARNMQTISGMWHKGVSAPLGKLLETPERMGEELAQTMFGAEPEVHKDETELMGEIFMVPLTAVVTPLHEFADSPTWDDYPNVRGVLKFGADALGIISMGLFFHGGPVAAARRVDPIVKKAHDIDGREKVIEASGLDEIIKTAQKKVLDTEKVQLELEIKSLKKELDHGKLAKENLKEKGKKVKEAKEGVDIETEAIRAERLKFAEEAAKKIPEEKPKTGIKLIKKEPKPPEPVTNLDLQTGAKEPPSLSTHKSPFRETPERTQVMKDVYAEKAEAVRSNPELMTNKLLNDVNRWLDGEDLLVEKAKNDLSELAARAEELERLFVSKTDFLRWKDTVSSAATWARNADRLKIERTGITLDTLGLQQIYESIMSPELKQLHEHKARTLGFEKAGGSFVEGYLKNMARVAEKTDMDAAMDAYNALDMYKRGDIRQASLKAEKVLGKLHRTERDALGTKLYSGLPLDEAAKTLIKGAKDFADYLDKSYSMKAFKPIQAAKMIKEEGIKALVDRSGNIRKDFLDSLGDVGYDIVQKMYLAKGASSISANMLKQMRKEVYGGLSRLEKKILDGIILSDRMIDISKYKTNFKYPEYISFSGKVPDKSITWREVYRHHYKLTTEQAAVLERRAKAYFEWMKKPLKDMLEAELITEKEYNDLVAHNYRRIKLIDIYDSRYTVKIGKKTRNVYDSGIESLSRGRETDIYERSSEIMALEVFNRAYGRILNNNANKALLDLAKKDKDNPFVRFKEGEGDKIPSGWNRIFVYDKGERKNIHISPEMSKEWIISNPETTYKFGQVMRYASGSPVLRTFATGINWGFALANLPRDVMHIWFTARTFKDGSWKSVYSPHWPVFTGQITTDLVRVFGDAALRKDKYNKYIEEGGGMEFLVHQGRLVRRGKHIEGPIDKIYDVLGYFGETTELMSRLAVRERVIRRRAKELGISVEEARKNPKLTQEATFAARDYMDFGQGGGISKALDNALPYLNASIQGTRGLFRSFKSGSGSALSSTYKLAQFAALTSGLYIAMRSMHPKSTQALQGSMDMQNNLCIPLGDDFGFEDKHGQRRYPYFKIPLDPGQKFFKTFFDASTDKWLGNEIDVDRVTGALSEASPFGITTLPPSVSGLLGYVTNKDFWLNKDIWRKTDKPFSWPESKEEYIPGRTPQVYIDTGELTGLSPERTRHVIEELTTSGTLWSYLLGQGYELAFGDLPKNKKEQHLAMVISKTPVTRRFFGVTNPYTQFAKDISEAEEFSDLNRWIQNRGLDVRAEAYIYDETGTKKEIIDYMKSFRDIDVFDRLKDRFMFHQGIKGLPNRSFWLRLKSLDVEARAKVYMDRLNGATPEERLELKEEIGKVIELGEVITPKFMEEVSKLKKLD